MPVRIENPDGMGFKTKIIDTETGADITKALDVEYGVVIRIDDMVRAQLPLAFLHTEVVAGKVEWLMKSPATDSYRPVRHIEFCDGTQLQLLENGAVLVNGKPLGALDDGAVTVHAIGSEHVQKFRGTPAA